MALALTIDMGTTNLKIGLVDERGNILNVRAVPAPVIASKDGAVEQDPEALKKAIIVLSKQLLTEKVAPEVEYIIGSSYQCGMMLLDKKKLPLSGITLLSDIRSQSTYSDFLELYKDMDLYLETGCPLITIYPLPRLFYFKEKETGLFQRIGYVADSKSFFFEWLTGKFVTDYSTAAATQMYHIGKEGWDEAVVERLGLSIEQLPTIEDGTSYLRPLKKELAGILGLREEVKVVLGVYDGAALAIGFGQQKPQTGIINVGTSAMLRVKGEKPIFDKSENKRIQPYILRKGSYLNGGALNNAALAVNWMNGIFNGVNFQSPEMLEAKQKSPLFCLPYLTSERDSKAGPFASGVFLGLRQSHTKLDLGRSVLEGVAYTMRYLNEALEENNLYLDEFLMGGGGIRINPWPQIFADILQKPIYISEEDHVALRGGATIAFNIENRAYSIENEIWKNWKKIVPRSEYLDLYTKRYLFFKEMKDSLSPIFKEHSLIS